MVSLFLLRPGLILINCGPVTEPQARARSILVFPTNEFGNLLHHLWLDAGIAVLRKGAAWIGCNGMTALKRLARFVGGWDGREQRRGAGWWAELAVVILVPHDLGRNRNAR